MLKNRVLKISKNILKRFDIDNKELKKFKT